MRFIGAKHQGSIVKYKRKYNLKKKFKEQLKPFKNLKYGDGKLKVPSRIGHSYIPVKVLPFDELYTKYNKHKRLRVFANKGLKCVVPGCKQEGKYLILTLDKGGNYHVDLYTDDFSLMTIDHIHPKSKGGKNTLENLDPMCQQHNSEKGDSLLESYDVIDTATKSSIVPTKIYYFKSPKNTYEVRISTYQGTDENYFSIGFGISQMLGYDTSVVVNENPYEVMDTVFNIAKEFVMKNKKVGLTVDGFIFSFTGDKVKNEQRLSIFQTTFWN